MRFTTKNGLVLSAINASREIKICSAAWKKEKRLEQSRKVNPKRHINYAKKICGLTSIWFRLYQGFSCL